jgi:hypothetical protein
MISLNCINQLVFIMETQLVSCDVRYEFSDTVQN